MYFEIQIPLYLEITLALDCLDCRVRARAVGLVPWRSKNIGCSVKKKKCYKNFPDCKELG